MNKWQALEKLLNDFHEDVPENFWLDEEFVLLLVTGMDLILICKFIF